jgi:hypothetical protein
VVSAAAAAAAVPPVSRTVSDPQLTRSSNPFVEQDDTQPACPSPHLRWESQPAVLAATTNPFGEPDGPSTVANPFAADAEPCTSNPFVDQPGPAAPASNPLAEEEPAYAANPFSAFPASNPFTPDPELASNPFVPDPEPSYSNPFAEQPNPAFYPSAADPPALPVAAATPSPASNPFAPSTPALPVVEPSPPLPPPSTSKSQRSTPKPAPAAPKPQPPAASSAASPLGAAEPPKKAPSAALAAAKELLHRKQAPPALVVPQTPAANFADAVSSGRDNAEAARRWQQTKQQLAAAQADAEGAATLETSAAAVAAASSIQKLRQELCQAALLESAVFCQPASHGAVAHELHAPARHLAAAFCRNDNRNGGAFACLSHQRVVDALAVMVLASGDDLPRAAFWCSNVMALRACLSARLSTQKKGCEHGGEGEEGEQRLAAAVAALQTLEAAAYHRLLHIAWWRQLVPAMQLIACDGVAPEAAAAHWAEAAAAVRKAFCPARAAGASCGCLPHLGHQVMAECLRRLDVALFNALLRGPQQSGGERRSEDPVADPLSDEAAVKLVPGALQPSSFGAGMRVKMFIGDLTDSLETAHHSWLAAGGRQILNGEVLRPFPFVRSAADVLMMPKDGLQDPSVRADVCPRLQLPQLLRLLEHFEPDEYAPEKIPTALMASLRASAAASRIAAAVTVANGAFDTADGEAHDSAPSCPTTPSGNSTVLLRAPRAAWVAPSPRDVALHAGLLVDEQHHPHSGDFSGEGSSGDQQAASAWREAR